MSAVTEVFNERLQEIETYLDLLDALDRQVQSGPPEIGGSPITVRQQRILYSSVYLQLYNLVEATVACCIDAICTASAIDGKWKTEDLTQELRREWTRLTARTHLFMNEERRLSYTVKALDKVIQGEAVSWPPDRPRRGNWDDDAIAALSAKLGCELQLSPEVYEAVKRPIRDDKGPLKLIRDLRNRLAHGALSFEECGTGVTVTDLRETKDKTVSYLRVVVAAFSTHVDEHRFLVPAKRPVVPQVGP